MTLTEIQRRTDAGTRRTSDLVWLLERCRKLQQEAKVAKSLGLAVDRLTAQLDTLQKELELARRDADRAWEVALSASKECMRMAEQLRQARLRQWHLPAVLWIDDQTRTYWPE